MQKPPRLNRRVRFDQVRVAKSPNGLGVFATSPIQAFQAVGQIHGKIMPAGYRSEYCMGFGDGGLEPDEPYRRVNHSCDPNCELIEWNIPNPDTGEIVRELWLQTIRPVALDEELTIDYAWESKAAIVCHCGSPKCRGWIVKKDE